MNGEGMIAKLFITYTLLPPKIGFYIKQPKTIAILYTIIIVVELFWC
jgi:hypothetical protein